ncbi:MAG: tyrosine-protein phosphatase [Candidatus Omnitrophota bacterium]
MGLWISSSSTYSDGDSRWIELAGPQNMRDVGGLTTKDGLRIRPGILFRCSRLAEATEDDCVRLHSLGLRTVLDLRSEGEIWANPDAPCILEKVEYKPLPIVIGSFATLEEIYLDIVNTYAPSIAGVFKDIANPQNLPILYHCTLGKDRTGITTALLYLLLGVDQEKIMSDYLLSLEAGYWVDPAWLQAVLDQVEREGGIEIFLSNRSVNAEIQAAVKENLLEPSSAVEEWRIH